MTTYRERHLDGHYDPNKETPATSKAAQAKADELGIDITTIQGSGKDGRVTVADIEAARQTTTE